MARRRLWMIGGMAVVGALALSPDSRLWLRRRLGLEPEDRRWFEEPDAHPEHEGDEPMDTREARFSLRARLAEEAQEDEAPAAEPAAWEPPAAAPEPEPEVASAAAPAWPAREAVEEPEPASHAAPAW